MSEDILNKKECFHSLPAEWDINPFPFILERLNQDSEKLVILDDDPTGTQTVHGIPVLTSWDLKTLVRELKREEKTFFILTNSRALTKQDACRLAREIGSNLKQASDSTGTRVSVISRSDSTLRGHFPHEVDEVAKAMGEDDLPYLIFPFFEEGGRFTISNTHYVAEGESLVPAAQTSYAKDASFGFKNSNLCQWVEEKTKGKIPINQVTAVSLIDIRNGGPTQVADILMSMSKSGKPKSSKTEKEACIVNAVSYRDVEVFVAGLLLAMTKGRKFLYRTAASFVRVMAGVTPLEVLLSKKDLVSEDSTGGLFVVGSYVPKTTAQVNALMDNPGILSVELSVKNILEPTSRKKEINKITTTINTELLKGKDIVLYTSRDLITDETPEKNLEIGRQVSSSLVQIVKGLNCRPRYLVAKGGITSSDVATKGLNVKRAMVMGQALPGVPVWKLGDESLHPGMPYIIFPGNVGDDHALATIQENLSSGL